MLSWYIYVLQFSTYVFAATSSHVVYRELKNAPRIVCSGKSPVFDKTLICQVLRIVARYFNIKPIKHYKYPLLSLSVIIILSCSPCWFIPSQKKLQLTVFMSFQHGYYSVRSCRSKYLEILSLVYIFMWTTLAILTKCACIHLLLPCSFSLESNTWCHSHNNCLTTLFTSQPCHNNCDK